MPVRISPIIEPAGDAILVGDPRRAFALAQALTVQPKMSHLARGLWGYTGETGSGRPLTIQSTGIGGPGAVTVIADLHEAGVRRVVRLGTCVATGTLPGEPVAVAPGDAFLIESAFCGDGASAAITGGEPKVDPDPDLTASLEGIARRAEVFSHDLLPRLVAGPLQADPAPLRDLQTAATFAIAASLEIPAAAILVVAETGPGHRLDEPELEKLFVPLGEAVVEALGRQRPPDVNPRLEG